MESEFGADGSKKVTEVQAKVNEERLLKNAARREVRDLESDLAKAKDESKTRLRKMGELECRVGELKEEIDECVEMERECARLKALVASVPNFLPARGVGMGRGAPRYPLEFRYLLWGQVTRRTPPTAVPANVVQCIKMTAPWVAVQAPTPDFVRKCRGEATIIGEICEAWRLADATSWMSIGWDESTKWQVGLMSTNIQVLHITSH